MSVCRYGNSGVKAETATAWLASGRTESIENDPYDSKETMKAKQVFPQSADYLLHICF